MNKTKVQSMFLATALAAAAAVPVTTSAQSASGYGDGYTTTTMRVEGAPLLKGFYFRYDNDDHHILNVAAQPHTPSLGQLTLAYMDNNGDDRYFYNVLFSPYYGEIFRRTNPTQYCKGRCTMPIQAPANRQDYVFVVTGFNIYYRGGDHHIDEVRLTEDGGNVTVAFNDNNDDDLFAWDLQYSYIPRSRFTALDARSGTAAGAAGATIENGNAVLRGFVFNFENDDHHIKDFGVWMGYAGQLQVYYGDRNQDDRFKWVVDYGILN